MEKYLKNPLYAALFAAGVTAGAIHLSRAADAKLKNSDYTKPALFVGVLVYFIIYYGNSQYETISKEPF